MRSHKTIAGEIEFVKVRDNIYNVKVDSITLNKFVTEIVESFTVCKVDKFSPLMDIPISEELIARIIADAFVSKKEELVRSTLGGVIVNCSINEINYKVSIACNDDKLGGIIYGVLS